MPLDKPIQIDLHIYRYPLMTAEQRSRYLGCMSDLELERLDSKNTSQADSYIAERGFTREVLSRYLGQPPASIQLSYGDKGKPQISGASAPLYFSQSHCRDLFVVAVSTESDLGVDVERTRRSNNLERIALHYFSQPEIDFLTCASEELNQRFALLWTSKESIGKLLGTGISKNLLKNATLLRQGKIYPNNDWLDKPLSLANLINDDHLISLAVQSESAPEVTIAEESWKLV